MKKYLKVIFSFVLGLLATAMGVSSGVMVANAAPLPDAGVTRTDGGADPNGGIATETGARKDGDPDFITKEIDEKIVKIRPMATPIDNISRHATAKPSDSFEVKYYSVGTRPLKTKVKTQFEAMASGESQKLEVDDASIFTKDDTIRVVGVKATTDASGQAYGEGANVPDLVLWVVGTDNSTGHPIVCAINGSKKDGNGEPIWAPQINVGTVLVRMGKACGELDVQTGRFNNLPLAEIQYCQNFMMQVEQSTFDKIAGKEVKWDFSDIEEDGIYDMRLGMEQSFLFGDKACIHHVNKEGAATWFTRGIWYMAGKDIEVGHWNAETSTAEVSDDDLVDISKDLFVGTGNSTKRVVLFCGSDMLAALSKIKSEKFRLKESVEHWNLKFKSWETDFGEILTMHHELFDLNGMADCAFALDPEYLQKRTHVSWSRNILDLKKAGVRNTDAVVLQEVSCLYLRYAKAHARLKLAAEA